MTVCSQPMIVYVQLNKIFWFVRCFVFVLTPPCTSRCKEDDTFLNVLVIEMYIYTWI